MSVPPMMMWDTARAGAPAIRDMGLAWRQFMGIPDGRGWSTLADYARAPADEAWVHICVRRRYTAAMSVPLVVYVKDGPQRIPAAESSDSAAKDLQFLLDDVNPVDMQGGDLKAYLEAGLAVWGEGYIKKVRGRLGGPPQELYWLRAPDVEPDPPMGRVTGYRYQPIDGMRAETYLTRDVIAWKTVNLMDPRRGLSPLAAVRTEMRVNIGAAETTASTLENWGVPAGAWVAPKGADIGPQDHRLITRALKALRGPRNQGKTPVLPEGLDWKPLSINPKDAEWLAARKVSRMTICAALGVPLVLAGDDEKTTVYANLRDAERIFWRNTMIPELDWIADGFNSWLVPDFDPKRERIVIGFDYSQIESLQDPVTTRKALALKELDAGVRTRNEYRSEFRMGPPIPDEEADEFEALDEAPETTVGETPPAPNPADVPDPSAAVRSLGKGLYKHDAVRAYLATGDPSVLESIVAPADVEALALGLQRRLPAAKLAETWEPAATPAPSPSVVIQMDPGRVDAAAKDAMSGAAGAALSDIRDEMADSGTAMLRLVTAIRDESRVGMQDVRDQVAALSAPRSVKVLERDDKGRASVLEDGGVVYDVTRDESGRVAAKTPRV